MPFNSLVTRTDASPLIPEDASREILQGITETSIIMRLGRRLPDMARAQRRLPILQALMTAYFVTGDTGLKQTTEVAWGNKYIDAEELAVIVPIPQNVLDDADYDIWAQIRQPLIEAFGKAFDQAVLYGINAPAAWPDDIKLGATTASQTVVAGSGVDAYDEIMKTGGLLSMVEEDGFMINGHVAAMSMKSRLREIRDANGQPIFVNSMQAPVQYDLDGSPLIFPRNGSMIPATALMFSGDWSQLVWAMRQDLDYRLLTESVIQDGAGAIIYNLAQQDMVALRATMRLGWQLPNPINQLQPTEANRYPFAVYLP